MFRVNRKAVFDNLSAPDDVECEGCKDLHSWVESYEIGDETVKEREYDCRGNCMDCQRVDDEALEIELFIHDNKEIFQNIEWID